MTHASTDSVPADEPQPRPSGRTKHRIRYFLSEYSAPEPDFAIVTAKSVWAKAQKADWMIEISVSSLRKDRGLKALLYAAGGIREYWVVDGNAMEIIIHREASPSGYRSITTHARHERVAPQAFPDLVVSLDELLEDRARLVP